MFLPARRFETIKYFSYSWFSLAQGSRYARWVPKVWTDITQQKDVEQQVIIFIIYILGLWSLTQNIKIYFFIRSIIGSTLHPGLLVKIKFDE